MKKYASSLVAAFFFTACLCAQEGGYPYTFGRYGGVNFLDNPPNFFRSKATALFGNAVISNDDARLLFYVSGENVYDSTHHKTLDKLKADTTFSKSALILPDTLNKHYIFTTISQKSGAGIFYTYYDATNHKPISINKPLISGDATDYFAGLHATGEHTSPSAKKKNWLLTHRISYAKKIGELRTYSVSTDGIKSPIISDLQIPFSKLKYGLSQRIHTDISPYGSSLALCFEKDRLLLIYDFNRFSGKIEGKARVVNLKFEAPAGLEFSGFYLYISQGLRVGADNASIYRYDIRLQDVSGTRRTGLDIERSLAQVATIRKKDYPWLDLSKSELYFGDMQQSPRRIRIYVGVISASPSELGIAKEIPTPSSYLASINYHTTSSPVFNPREMLLRDSLGENLASGEFSNIARSEIDWRKLNRSIVFCQGQEGTIRHVPPLTYTYISWNFGDPASGSANIYNKPVGRHTYNTPGLYTVTVNYRRTRDTTLINGTSTIRVLETPKLDLGKDRYICGGKTTLDAAANFTKKQIVGAVYKWGDGSRTRTKEIKKSGIYEVEVVYKRCTVSDAVRIDVLSDFSVALGADTMLCHGETLTLGDSVARVGLGYKWFLEGNPIEISRHHNYKVSRAGTYIMEANSTCFVQRDTITVTYPSYAPLKLDLGLDQKLRYNQKIILDAAKDLTVAQAQNTKFTWSDGSHTPTLSVQKPGLYLVALDYKACRYRDSVRIDYLSELKLNLAVDTTLCKTDRYTVDLGKDLTTKQQNEVRYLWSDGDKSRVRTFDHAVDLEAKVIWGTYFSSGRLRLNYHKMPAVLLRDTSFCAANQSHITLDAGDFEKYFWSTGERDRMIQVARSGSYTADLTYANGACHYKATAAVSRSMGPDFKLSLQDRRLDIHPLGNEAMPYVYSLDGDHYQAKPYFSNLLPGTYRVWAKNATGCIAISLPVEVKISPPKFFTPNGDGINDRWKVEGLGLYQEAAVMIFDRYGRELYRYAKGDLGWDGTFDGLLLPPNDYWYVIELKDSERGNKVLKGHFTLLRE